MLILNPAWPHFLGVFSLGLACFLGVFHWVIEGWEDPTHCKALLNEGSWLDSNYKNWQPDGCMLHTYTEAEASSCLKSKEVLFIGDSVTRKLFFELARSLDVFLSKTPFDQTKKHSDHTLQTKYGATLKFAWDPFLNSTYTQGVLSRAEETRAPRPAMLVIGSGLWYLRYANTSGGIPAWEKNMERIFTSLAVEPKPADEVVILPVGQIIATKLTAERASTMHPSDIEAMNSDLYHRINPPVESYSYLDMLKAPPSHDIAALPLVFNKMLDESLTEDGLHYSDALLNIQARILMNLRCNDHMPKTFPLAKTCCNRYPSPSAPHVIALALILLSGPFVAIKVYRSGFGGLQAAILGQHALAPLIISLALGLIYLADRSNLWSKEQKQFDAWGFSILCLLSLAVGVVTVKRSDKDLGFLNRDQTDEWKGWMQVVILIYHYYRASKISGIYNPVRVLVASYLFMTGYGHTTFYLRKADFSFSRIAQVLIRLNLFTILLAYTMNTDYISYYFTPLVSMWFIIIYVTLVLGSQYNNRTPLLLAKILLSAGLVKWFFNESWLLEVLFDFLHQFCAIHWSAREWSFRVNLDIYMVYVGMLSSIAVMKIREHRLTDHPQWPQAFRISVVLSVLVFFWFFAFELYQESKFTYNTWHPYISFLPVLAFAVLRNSSVILRSASSRAFAFVGKCSLECFIVQYHFWLAGDSKGVLLVLAGTRWRPVNFIITSVMFLYLCDRIAFATSDITSRLCGGEKEKELPLPVTAAPQVVEEAAADTVFDADAEEERDGQEVTIPMRMLNDPRKDHDGNPMPFEPDTPIRPRRWIDRLAEESVIQTSAPSSLRGWLVQSGSNGVPLHVRLFLFLVVLWVFNICWPYPPESGR